MKRWSTLAGSAVAVASMVLVLYLYAGDLRRIHWFNAAVLPELAISVALYVLVVILGAVAWRILLRSAGGPNAPWLAERHLLLTQIGKYLPGNVAQYIGRAAVTMRSGVGPKVVGMALASEAAATVLGGLLSCAASLAIAPRAVGDLRRTLPANSALIWAAMGAASLLTVLLGAKLIAIFSNSGGFPNVKVRALVNATFLYALGFLVLGLSFHLVVSSFSSSPVSPTLSIALFAAAWFAGLATPGAPGGLGVRESVLTLGLAPAIGGPAALSASLVYRGVSVLGDVISFCIGLLLPKKGGLPQNSDETTIS